MSTQIKHGIQFIGQTIVKNVAQSVFTGVSAGASVTSGALAKRAFDQEAELQDEQGQIIHAEAIEAADIFDRDAASERASMGMSFIKGGVTLAGSPMGQIEAQKVEDKEFSDSKRKQGASKARVAHKQSEVTKVKGTSALVGGVGQAVKTTSTLFT
jgi:hypothetical protein